MMAEEIYIDGSQGEGGGQIIRTSLSLSVITGKPFVMDNIREGRSKPGLQAQHVTCVNAAAHICGGKVEGAKRGSQSIRFEPGAVKSGTYAFDVGTAGSVSLVLQTVYLPLLFADDPSEVTITGGTHVEWSPSFTYLQSQWLPFMKKAGIDISLRLDRAGFYPEGGGRVTAKIKPAKILYPVEIPHRGNILNIDGIVVIANLPQNIAERQLKRMQDALYNTGIKCFWDMQALPGKAQGTASHLFVRFENGGGGFTALGEKNKKSETVAAEVADELIGFLDTEGTVDEYLADQLILPLCLAQGKSQFVTPEITSHLLTNIDIVKKFLPARITVAGKKGDEGLITINGIPLN